MSTQEALLKALSARVSADGTVQVHRAVLAAETGSSARTVDRGLKALRDAGELDIVTGGRFGTPTVYRLTRHSAPVLPAQRAIRSAPPTKPQVTQRATANVQVAQRATEKPQVAQRAMCVAGCRYPLDRIWIESGIDMHPWCELGVTSSHATDAQKIAALRQAERDQHSATRYQKAA